MSTAPEVAGFDAADRAERVAKSAAIRETIAADVAKLMIVAKAGGWGEVEGLPTLAGGVLVYHFSSGRRGIIHLPNAAQTER